MDTENYYRGVVVNRKRKNRRKRKQMLTLNTNISNESTRNEDLNNVESTGDSNCTDNDDDDQTIEIVNGEEVMNRASVDGTMKAPPQYEHSEVDRREQKELTMELTTNQFQPDTPVDTKSLQQSELLERQLEMNGLEVPKVIPLVVPNVATTFENEDKVVTTQSTDAKAAQYNTRALSKDSCTYELEKFEKNALIIFNQESIDGREMRLGTEKDVNALTYTFRNFGFEVVEHKNLTKDVLFEELKSFSERDFTDYGCVAVAVLTHGSGNGILRAKDQQYSEKELVNHFETHDKPTLVTKPKLIIIQACRGMKVMTGVPVLQSGNIRRDLDENLEPYFLPSTSDLLLMHSSYAGSASHRHIIDGSWFIQSLCDKINELALTHDLDSIITEVKREVATNKSDQVYNMWTLEVDIIKQMPVTTSTLIRKLYFKKFGDATPVEKVSKNVTESSSCDALDNSSPLTPLLPQMGSCLCFLHHFSYIRDCLRYYVEDNPNDETALSYLELCSTFKEDVKFNRPKEETAKAICRHLMKYAKNCHFYKYLYFYKH